MQPNPSLAERIKAARQKTLLAQTVAPEAQVNVQGDTEEVMRNDLARLDRSFRGKSDVDARRALTTTDSTHWFCICFDTREQKEAFLSAKGWFIPGHPFLGSDQYLDGISVADLEKVELPPTSTSLSFIGERSDKALDDLCLPIPEESKNVK